MHACMRAIFAVGCVLLVLNCALCVVRRVRCVVCIYIFVYARKYARTQVYNYFILIIIL